MSSVRGRAVDSDAERQQSQLPIGPLIDAEPPESDPSIVPLMCIATVGAVFLLILSVVLANPTTRLGQAVLQLDQNLVLLLNRVARRSWIFDVLVWEVTRTVFLQGLLVALFWGLWYAPSPAPSIERRKRSTMLASLVGLNLAVVLTIVLRAVLPFRSRPSADPTLGFLSPFTPTGESLYATSTAFPAGHATVYFALAVALWAVSSRLGILASLVALLVICVPRIYIGLHFATDIVAGALVGTVMVLLANTFFLRSLLTRWVVAWSERHPATFGALLFLSCMEIAVEFQSIRGLLRLLQGDYINRLVG